MSLNKVFLQGRLCAAPEMRYTQSNTPVATFRLAVDRNYAGKDGTREADFLNVVCWGKSAEFVTTYFFKGSPALVEGSLKTRQYTDNGGVKHYVTEVNADHVYFDGRASGERQHLQEQAQEVPEAPELTEYEQEDEGLPF